MPYSFCQFNSFCTITYCRENNKLKKAAIDIIEPKIKRSTITPLKKQIDAATRLQAAIKRIEPNKLLARQMEICLENQYEKIDKKVPLIQAVIKRKLALKK
jgi:uncharacterized protein YdgA (DUF945 family)